MTPISVKIKRRGNRWLNETVEQRLARHTTLDENTGCWNWTATKNSYGYGRIGIAGKMQQAHRVSYELHCGPIPEGMLVCHKCDNPACLNPEHLFLGTNAENAADMVAKGRQAQGRANGQAKLTERDVIAIRRATGFLHRELAEQYGVSRRLISFIRTGKVWSHIDTEAS